MERDKIETHKLLGASPGSWSQIAAKRYNCNVCAVDLNALSIEISNVHMIVGDAFEASTQSAVREWLQGELADVILSDMAPVTTGIKSVDAARAAEMVELAAQFAALFLRDNGVLVAKFRGTAMLSEISQALRQFGRVRRHKPPASRAESAELFVIADRFRRESSD